MTLEELKNIENIFEQLKAKEERYKCSCNNQLLGQVTRTLIKSDEFEKANHALKVAIENENI